MKSGRTLARCASVIAAMLLLSLPPIALTQVKVKEITEAIDVVVKEGDNLTAIVQRVMGSVEFWPETAKNNRITRPDALKPGQIIRFPSELVQKRNFANIAFSKGDAKLVRRGTDEELPAERGEHVFLGDIIATGEDGFVSLSFAGETLVNIQPESRVQIVEFDCFDKQKSCVVNLMADRGQMSFDVRNVGFEKPPRYSIETPYASAAVRGTRFDVDVNNGSVLGVTEGAVQVTSGVLTMPLPTGKGTLAGGGRSITTQYDLLSAPEYKAFIRLSAEDYISWTPIDDATTYRYVLADNESLTDVIVSGSSANSHLGVPPEPSQFFLGTRALDENGIKGFRAIQRIDQVGINESAQAPALEIELSENQLAIVNTGDVTSEVHVGAALQSVGDLDQLLDFAAYDISAGDRLELTVEANQDVYIASRAVLNDATVSLYGNIYEFKRGAK